MPRVSIIMPTRNRAHMIRSAIDSIQQQSYGDFELIIIDDESTDGTESLIQSIADDRIRLFKNAQRLGVSASRNIGIQQARGELIAFLDSDDTWHLDKLEKQILHYDNLGGGDRLVACHATRNSNGVDYKLPANTVSSKPGDSLWPLLSNPVTFVQTWLLPQQVIQSVGLFDAKLEMWEDWELLIRIALLYPVDFMDESLVTLANLPDSLSKNTANRSAAMRRIIDKHAKLLREQPKTDALWHYLLARSLIFNYEYKEAKAALQAARRVKPQAKTLILWLLLMFGLSPVARLWIKVREKS